jgi:putative transcriptional regulator
MPDLRGLRIFAGHAGWGADQLVEEIAEGAWYVLDGLPDDILVGPLVDLWFRVLRRQPMPLALEAYHPGDLSRN